MLCPSVFILEFRQAFTDYYFLKQFCSIFFSKIVGLKGEKGSTGLIGVPGTSVPGPVGPKGDTGKFKQISVIYICKGNSDIKFSLIFFFRALLT